MRVVVLLVTGVSLYLLAPSLLEVFSSWPKLRSVNPIWIVPAVVFEATSYVSLWTLQRIALRTRSWFAVGTSQLAAGAAGSVVPGGGAAAAAIQFGMLVRARVPAANVAPGPDRELRGHDRDSPRAAGRRLRGRARRSRDAARAARGRLPRRRRVRAARARRRLGLPLRAAAALVGRTVRAAAGLVGRRARFEDLPARLLRQRDGVRSAIADRPVIAVLGALGKWGFDYLTLICVLAALGVRPDPALVLLAYAAAVLLGMIPATPGGLGFVEAGLTGLLALAGVAAGAAAVATLTYRLISFWLPLPAGAVAYWLARRRYGRPNASATSAATSEAISSPP